MMRRCAISPSFPRRRETTGQSSWVRPEFPRNSFAGPSRARFSLAGVVLVLAVLSAACGEAVTPLASAPTPSSDERTFPPIDLPADEAPHDNLSEWWYFTGRMTTGDRRTLGFEFVIFQAVRGGGPPAYAAHFSITDVSAGEMLFDERTSLGPSQGPPEDLDLCVDGWRLAFDGDRFAIDADMPGYAVNLEFDPVYPAVEHHDGLLDFGALGWSYYYSYPRMNVTGRLADAGGEFGVSGSAWFDHQWGDFISVSSGGWDWMSLRFDDGRDLMLTELWDERRRLVLAYATLSGRGPPLHFTGDDFTTIPLAIWMSPRSGATYPAAWRVLIPVLGLDVLVQPVLADQEMNTRQSTGTIYWEGLVDIIENGRTVGYGYVELTGYAKAPGVSGVSAERKPVRACVGQEQSG